MKTIRTDWGNIDDVIIQSPESAVKQHPEYNAAKSGDMAAASVLVRESVSDEKVKEIKKIVNGRRPLVIGVLAQESTGLNAIPQAYADYLAEKLGLDTHDNVVQINVVGHTGSSGFHRLANQPLFDGTIPEGIEVLIVDDFVGMGGTLANLKGHIEQQGASVIGCIQGVKVC